MKKIIINGRFFIHRVTGVERYARELLAEFDKIIEKGNVEIAVPPEVQEIPDYQNIKVIRIGKLHNRLWEHISFPVYVKKMQGVSLNLCNVAPLFNPGIVCIHDVKIKARPQDFSRKFLLWYSFLFYNIVRRAKKIITVSEFSKKEICKYYKINPDKIIVIPNAWQHFERVKYDEHALEKYKLTKDGYYFSMCSLEPNKNFKWIAEAAKDNNDLLFAVAGSINKTVFADDNGFHCSKNMKFLGYVTDEEAKTLMRECRAFLFPTFYEGFGIPPLEAMSTGCKCIMVSDTEVMHEVFGDSVIYIDPQKVHNLIESQMQPKETKDNPLEKYSWSTSAKLLKTYLEKENEK